MPSTVRRMRLLLLVLLTLPALTAAEPYHPAPVTLVAVPWGLASVNGGEAFVLPTTVLLEPGEYRISVSRDGYLPVESTLVVTDERPQHRLFRLERR